MQHRLTPTQNNCHGGRRVGVPSGHNFLRGAHSTRIVTVPNHHKSGSEPEMDANALLGSSGFLHHLRRPEHGCLCLRSHRSKKHY